jgi:hypothetical protein
MTSSLAGPAATRRKGTQAMADDEQSTSGVIPTAVQGFIAQLRGVTEGLEGLTALPGRLPSARNAFPLPGVLSATQVSSIAENVAAQRRSIETLQAQLSAFDQQLAVLEQILGPLAQWSGTWAELEQRVMRLYPGYGGDDKPGGPGGK